MGMQSVKIAGRGGQIIDGQIIPMAGWPIRHLNANTAGVKQLLPTPGNDKSHYVTGFILNGGATANGFHLLRRNCVRLVSTGDFFTITSAAALVPDSADFTVVCWVKIPSTITGIPKIMHKDDGSNKGYILSLTASKAKILIGDGAGNTADVSSAQDINDDEWHLIVATCDRNVEAGLLIYVDGVLAGTTTDDVTAVGALDDTTNITVYGVATYDWYISNMGYYEGASGCLSAAAVLALYNDGIGLKFSGLETGLAAAWNLDEGIGTVGYDVFGNSNISMTGTPVWCPHKAAAPEPKDETCGAPFDSDDTLDAIGKFITTVGVVGAGPATEYAYAVHSNIVNFPHAIKIGRNNPLRILETDGQWDLILFGFTGKY